MNDDIAQPTAGGPAPTMSAGAPHALIPAGDIRSLRAFRATAKAAGGVLDLVMPMRVGGDGPSLFCVHPLIGLSWCYLALLPSVDARYPLYGLQARGVRRPEPLPVTMLEMAQDYADQIRTVQPAGPYHLLGWSLGGNIAFAVAEELERRGEQVGLLVILDSNLADPDAISAGNEAAWQFYNIILAQFGYVPALTPADQEPEARMLELVRRRPGLGLDEWPDKRVNALQRVIKNNVVVTVNHQPGRVRCPMLFLSCISDPPLAQKLETWRSFVDGPIEAVELDCDHSHMLLPEPAARIGPAITRALARAAVMPVRGGLRAAGGGDP